MADSFALLDDDVASNNNVAASSADSGGGASSSSSSSSSGNSERRRSSKKKKKKGGAGGGRAGDGAILSKIPAYVPIGGGSPTVDTAAANNDGGGARRASSRHRHSPPSSPVRASYIAPSSRTFSSSSSSSDGLRMRAHSLTTKPTSTALRHDFTTIDWYSQKSKMLRSRMSTVAFNNVRGWRGKATNMYNSLQGWIVLICVGVLTAMTASFIHIASSFLTGLKEGVCTPAWWITHHACCESQIGGQGCDDWQSWSELGGVDGLRAWWLDYVVYVVWSVGFACVCAWIVALYKPQAAGSGVAEVKTILGGYVIRGYLGLWLLLIKTIGLVLSVGSGLSLGKEGPLIHISCCWGNVVTRWFSKYKTNQAKKREVLSASTAAGVAAAFGAPLGGILFSLESVSTNFSPKTHWRSFFCAITVTLVISYMNPFGQGNLALFQVTYTNPWHWFELVFFLLLGCAGGLLGVLFLRLNMYCNQYADRSAWMQRHRIGTVTVLSLVSALINFPNVFTRSNMVNLLAALFSDCNNLDNRSLEDRDNAVELALCDDRVGNHRHRHMALLFATIFVRLLLTSATFGGVVKVPAGIFLPALSIGACMGRLVGWAVESWHDNTGDDGLFAVCAGVTQCISPGIYAVVGAAATLGGITRMSVSLTVIMFELTGGLKYIIPIMVASVSSAFVGNVWGKRGIYDLMIYYRGYPHLDAQLELSRIAPVAALMTPHPVCIPARAMTLASLRQLLATYTFQGFPLVRSPTDHTVCGYVGRSDLQIMVKLAADARERDDVAVHFVTARQLARLDRYYDGSAETHAQQRHHHQQQQQRQQQHRQQQQHGLSPLAHRRDSRFNRAGGGVGGGGERIRVSVDVPDSEFGDGDDYALSTMSSSSSSSSSMTIDDDDDDESGGGRASPHHKGSSRSHNADGLSCVDDSFRTFRYVAPTRVSPSSSSSLSSRRRKSKKKKGRKHKSGGDDGDDDGSDDGDSDDDDDDDDNDDGDDEQQTRTEDDEAAFRGYYDATDFVTQRHPVCVTSVTPSDRVLDQFQFLGLGYMIVCDRGRVVGLVKKIDLLLYLERIEHGGADTYAYNYAAFLGGGLGSGGDTKNANAAATLASQVTLADSGGYAQVHD